MEKIDNKIFKLNKKFNHIMKYIFIFSYICLFSFIGNCAWNTSINYKSVPGNIYHSYSSSKSSNRRANNTYIVDDVYIKDANNLVLNINNISAVWYQYDFQCRNHPNGKPVEFGSDSHGKWYSNIPRSTGYIGYSYCNFDKKLHYICCQVGNKKYKIEFTQRNFNILIEKIGSKFKLEKPNEKDFPYIVTAEEEHNNNKASLISEFNYWNDAKNNCIKFIKILSYIAIVSIIVLMITILFKFKNDIKQFVFPFTFIILSSCLIMIIIQWGLYSNFSEDAEYCQIRLNLIN